MTTKVDDRSTAYLTMTMKDKDGDAEQPTSSFYKIQNRHGQEIKSKTALSPTGGIVTLTIGKAINTISHDETDPVERRVLVQGIYGADDEINKEYIYELERHKSDPMD
jgi:hypothetical protein